MLSFYDSVRLQSERHLGFPISKHLLKNVIVVTESSSLVCDCRSSIVSAVSCVQYSPGTSNCDALYASPDSTSTMIPESQRLPESHGKVSSVNTIPELRITPISQKQYSHKCQTIRFSTGGVCESMV